LKILLFDIDGTLLLDGKAAGRTFDRAFREIFGVEADSKNVKTQGRTDPDIAQEMAQLVLNRALTKEEFAQLTNCYFALLPEELANSENYHLMPGIAELCKTLHEHPEAALGLQTGNLEPSAMMKLERGGLRKYFAFGGFGSDSMDRREIIQIAIERAKKHCGLKEIAKSEIFVIGDAPQDIKAANENQVRTVAVATGAYSEEELRAEQPEYFLYDLKDNSRILALLGL